MAMFGQKRLSREGGVEIVVKELCTRMAKAGHKVTCYNRSGHHVSGAEYDRKTEYTGIRQRFVPTIEKKGLAAVSSSFFAALCSAFGVAFNGIYSIAGKFSNLYSTIYNIFNLSWTELIAVHFNDKDRQKKDKKL